MRSNEVGIPTGSNVLCVRPYNDSVKVYRNVVEFSVGNGGALRFQESNGTVHILAPTIRWHYAER